MLRHDIGGALQAWNALVGLVYVPHTEDEYRRLVALFHALVHAVDGGGGAGFGFLLCHVSVSVARVFNP